MSRRRRLIVSLAAWGHAYLIRTTPAASATLNKAPTQPALTSDEAVEPRFMVVSVTDAAGAPRDKRSAVPSAVTFVDGMLLAYGARCYTPSCPTPTGIGLSAYRLDGSTRF